MIVRDVAAASSRRFDLLVVGGGVHGASLAQQAARGGLAVCLCEAADFGGGASWNSLRIVHGGLRHLQTLDVARFRLAVRSRRGFARMFPSLLRPLHCLMPLYGHGFKRKSVMRAALAFNDGLSRDRNDAVPAALHVPPGRILDAVATLRAFPLTGTAGLQGAAVWSDLFMMSSERIVIELLRDACRHGAVALNYARVVGITHTATAVSGARVENALGGGAFEIAATAIADCSGTRLGDRLAQRDLMPGSFHPSLAFNLLLDVRPVSEYAVAVVPAGCRAPVLFVLPLDDAVLAGTMHVARPPHTLEARPQEGEIERFIGMLNAAIPGFGARIDDVRRVFAGLLPVTKARGLELERAASIVDHAGSGGPRGLFSVRGVKFSCAIEDARRALAVMGWPRPDLSATEQALTVSDETLALIDGALADPARLGEIVDRVVEEESVQDVEDFVLRRSNWASTGHEPAAARELVARRLQMRGTSRLTVAVNAQ